MAGKNPYPGINAHLNSALQPHGWATFHTPFLAKLTDVIDANLPDAYYCAAESSLQITREDPNYEFEPLSKDRSISDVLISRFADVGRKPDAPQGINVAVPDMTMPLETIIFPEEFVMSAIIYSVKNVTFPGKPIVRIELLSPGNKFPSDYYVDYLKKRRDSVVSGLRLVEIDFIHQRRPILPYIPDYTKREAKSNPYHVLVTDPHARDSIGEVALYWIGLLDPLPKLYVPLEEDDKFILDLASAYQRVYDNSRLFQQLGNLASELKNREAYSPDDQVRLAEFIKQH